MEDFGFEMFEEETPKKEEPFQKDYEENTKPKKQFNNYNKQNYNKKKSKKRRNAIDLFKETPEPTPIDFENIKTDKIVTIVFASKNLTLDNDEKTKIKNLLDMLKESGFKLRLLCNTVNPILDLLKDYGYENIFIIKPWDNYCKTGSYKSYLPTELNIKAAAYYFDKFDKLPTGIKYLNSALIEVMFGPNNNQALEYIITYDPNYDGKQINFDLSKDTAFWYWFPKKKFKDFGFSIFNVYNENDYNNLIKMLK